MLETPLYCTYPDFNFCTLLAGSEAPLSFITDYQAELFSPATPGGGLFVVHFNSIDESLRANRIALQYGPAPAS